jgi:hypothetical protein
MLTNGSGGGKNGVGQLLVISSRQPNPIRSKVVYRPFPRHQSRATAPAGTPPQQCFAVPGTDVDNPKTLASALSAAQAPAGVFHIAGRHVLWLGFVFHV